MNIFDTFPIVSTLDVLWYLFLDNKLFVLFVLFSFTLTWLLALFGILFSIKDFRNKERTEEEKKESVFPSLMLFVSLLSLATFGFYDMVRENVDFVLNHTEDTTLSVPEIKEWYISNASLIDDELSSVEYNYIDYEIGKIRTSDSKESLFLSEIGFENYVPVDFNILNSDSTITNLKAYIQFDPTKKFTGREKLLLKNTLEFGPEFSVGSGFYYGTLTN